MAWDGLGAAELATSVMPVIFRDENLQGLLPASELQLPGVGILMACAGHVNSSAEAASPLLGVPGRFA
jgi:hypothetical protein